MVSVVACGPQVCEFDVPLCSSCPVVPRPTQLSIPLGSVNEEQLRLGRQRQVWFIPFVDKCTGVLVKLWNPSTTCATPECFCSKVPSLMGAISRVWPLTPISKRQGYETGVSKVRVLAWNHRHRQMQEAGYISIYSNTGVGNSLLGLQSELLIFFKHRSIIVVSLAKKRGGLHIAAEHSWCF